VFVSESLTLGVPVAAVEHRLLSYLQVGDLASVASAAYREGVSVLARAGVGPIAKTVAIQSFPAYQRGPVTVVPIRWLATGPLGGAFPVLDANLEMTATDGHTTLTIMGSYRPPLGRLGDAVDRLVLKVVARSTIRSFLSRLGELAEEIVPAPTERRAAAGAPEPERP
jgi:hypothetical protein